MKHIVSRKVFPRCFLLCQFQGGCQHTVFVGIKIQDFGIKLRKQSKDRILLIEIEVNFNFSFQFPCNDMGFF